MAKLITRVGTLSDENRALLKLSPRPKRSYGGTIRRNSYFVGVYGKTLQEAIGEAINLMGINVESKVSSQTAGSQDQ